MSEDCLLEEDVWEYKSIRKLNLVSHDLESISKNVQKSNDGKDKSQQSNKRMASKERKTPRKTKQGPRKRDSQTPLKPEQQCRVSDDIPVVQSQEGISPASAKPNKNYKKQSPSKPRPVYEGYCPSCQMPFSLLLIQTPQWHVTECLDGTSMAEKECPDGLLCTSTIPSHYKRYSHLLLAASRAGEYVPELSSSSTETNSFMSGALLSIECNRVLQDRNDSQNVPANTMNVTNKIISLENTKESEHKIQCTDGSKHVGFFGSLFQEYGEDLKSQHGSYQPNTFTADSSDCEISYSPLNTDGEEAILTEEEEAEETKYFRKKQFDIRGIEEKSKEDGSSVFNASELKTFNHCYVERIQACTRNKSKMINTLQYTDRTSEPLSQGKIVNRVYDSTNVELLKLPTEDHSIPIEYNKSKEPFERLNLNSPLNTGGHGRSNCNWAGEDSAVKNKSLSPGFKEDGVMPFLFDQKEASCLAKTITGGGRNRLGPNNSYSLTEKEERFCNSIAMPVFPGPVSKILPYVPAANTQVKCNPAKELKQMDIGVFFGLQPKAKMEGDEKKNVSENMLTLSPSAAIGTRPRSRKRKAKGSVGDSDGITESSSKNSIPEDATSGGQRRWRKRFRESCPDEEETRKKQCPFYKKIPGTGFVVDAFQYGEIEGCKGYFLTHFHSDHYGGLTKTFSFPIYCNKITGNLVKSKLRVPEKHIHILPMNRECIIDGIKVVLLDANHCPGAAMILFTFPNGTVILHTGDFRADPSMEHYPFLIGRKVNTLYLDTTYCSPEYTFPSQQEVIQFAVNTAFETITINPRTLVVCGTYSIGKEKVFLAIADVLGSKVSMSQEKYKTLQCLESAAIDSLITLDWNNTLLHLLPMMQINFKSLQSHLNKFSEKFDQILAFKPTGWTYSDRCCSLSDIQPQTRGKITIYGIPYSEHSSFLEMKRFVQWLKPQKIIPTVNVGNWKARNEMEKHFRDWKMDAAGWK
ncbi:DNA cross-link repair 1A protein [Sceloporus undulatus]|uniref:DNA cross-link repair 1A protein n=1 Tax=Sceloporus undulatus TaxID=8520 RepID=UPI001C4D2150|nr:DNA cross-link repair 1A protein [Sceloporus undulatus]XP_042316410.1 DNA cross-link repair 1A protein [Sceloporus undulatus]XP_042316411.1 DNA cross-link repair 1A protein [Sceloporus undulatus]